MFLLNRRNLHVGSQKPTKHQQQGNNGESLQNTNSKGIIVLLK